MRPEEILGVVPVRSGGTGLSSVGNVGEVPISDGVEFRFGSLGLVTFAPLGSGLDDWPRLNALMVANAAKNSIVFLPGTYTCNTPGLVPSKTTLIMGPGVRIVSTMAFTGTQANCVFLANRVQAATSGITLTAANTVGASTLSVVSLSYTAPGPKTLQAGDSIFISAAANIFQAQHYIVRSIAGVGPFTLTLDRPVLIQFAIADVCIPSSPPTSIQIYGEGATITGTGDRAVQLQGAWKCLVQDLNVDASAGAFGDMGMSFDIANRDSTFLRCSVDLANQAGTYGIAIESGENSRTEECVTTRCGGMGIVLFDDWVCKVVRSRASGCGVAGLGVVGSAPSTLGSNDCDISGGQYDGNLTDGVVITGGSSRTTLDAVHADYNAAQGINVGGAAAGLAQDTKLTKCNATKNANGVVVQSGAKGTEAKNLECNDNSTAGVQALDNIDIDGYVARRNAVGAVYSTAGAVAYVRVDDFEFESPATGGAWTSMTFGVANLIVAVGKGRVTLKIANSLMVNHAGAGSVVNLTGPIDIVNQGAVAGCIGYSNNGNPGASVRRLGRCNFDTVATPFSIDAGAYKNFGTVTLNGATPVDYNFPDVRSTDRVTLTRLTTGGTPGAPPRFTIVGGTKVTVTGIAADTSNYAIEIG